MTPQGSGDWLEVRGTLEQRRELVRQIVEANMREQLEQIGDELRLTPATVDALLQKLMVLLEPGLDGATAMLMRGAPALH